MDEKLGHASFSNYGSSLDFIAPGVDIKSAYIRNSSSYATESGTSMATPAITAATAYVKLYHPNYTFNQVYNELKNESVDLGAEGFDQYYGWGYIKFEEAYGSKSGETEANDSNVGINTAKATGGILSQTITLSKKKYTISYGGKGSQLAASAKTNLTYKSKNTAIAAISKSGWITPKAPGVTTITITAASSDTYASAAANVTVIVKPGKVTIKNISAKKKSFTVKWTKAGKTKGYIIRYSTKKDMSNSKKVRITGQKTVKKTVSKLKRKKTYYVQVQSYADNGQRLLSSWSKKVKLRTK